MEPTFIGRENSGRKKANPFNQYQSSKKSHSLETGICVFLRLLFHHLFLLESESPSVVSDSFFDPVDCSLPGSSVHGILQARILEWNAISFSEVFIQLYHKDGTKSGLTIYQVAILFFLSSDATEWFSKNTETNKNFQRTFIFGGY